MEPQPIYASLSVDELVKKLRGVVSSGDEFDSKSEGYKTGPDTDVDESCLCIEKVCISSNKKDVYKKLGLGLYC